MTIDQEWIWRERLPLALVASRALYYFATSLLGGSGLSPALKSMRVSTFITEAAAIHGISLSARDLDALARFEAEFLSSTAQPRDSRSGDATRRHLDVKLVLRRKLDPGRPKRARSLVRRLLRRLKRLLSPLR